MKNIKIILIGLVLLLSGCVETVEIPTPIPTSHALTVISGLSTEYIVRCYDKELNVYNYTEQKLTYYINGTTEKTEVKKYDGYSIIEILIVPKYNPYIPHNNIYNSTEKCILSSLNTNYNIKRIINGETIINKNDYFSINGYNNFGCELDGNNKYYMLSGGGYFTSMYNCFDTMLSIEVFNEKYYDYILNKYR